MGIFKNWRTTVAGCGSLALVAFHAYQNPATLVDPTSIAQAMAGIGLIVAHDGRNTGPS